MKQFDFQQLERIMAALRAPDGCPWDRAQTHGSLRTCLIDETAEVLTAIDVLEQTGNGDNLCEELGDLLMQILIHSQIASEEGLFTMDDVIQGISEKMIRRHPYVFAPDGTHVSREAREQDPAARDVGAQRKSWEAIKAEEKAGQAASSLPSKKEILKNLLEQGEKRYHEIG